MILKTSWAIFAAALLTVQPVLAVNPPQATNTLPSQIDATNLWIKLEGTNLTCIGRVETYTCSTHEWLPHNNVVAYKWEYTPDGTNVLGGEIFSSNANVRWDTSGMKTVTVTHNSQALDPSGATIPEFDGQTTNLLVTVVKVDSISTNSTSDTTWPINVASNSTLTFYAKPSPGTLWPGGKPVWGGMASGSGSDTVNVTFSAPGETNVTAECGNVVTAEVNVLYLGIEKSDGDHICTFGPHAGKHDFKITIAPDPSPVPVTLELSPAPGCPSAAFVANGTSSLTVSNSVTLSVTGLVAGAGAVLRGRFDWPGMPWITNTFDVVNVNTFTLINRNCTHIPGPVSMDDTTPEANTPTQAVVEVMMKTNATTVDIGLKLSWTPTNHLGGFKWKMGTLLADLFGTENTEILRTVPVTAGVTNDVSAWFDCDGDNTVNAEPERNLKLLAVAFHGIKLRNVTTSVDDTCALGIGQTGIASNSVIIPSDRVMVWSCTVATNCDENVPVRIIATQVGNAYEIKVRDDSGTGKITLSVHDSKHPSCVVEELDIEIGCPCTSCAPGGMLTGVCSVHAAIDLGRTRGGGRAGRLDLSTDDLGTNSYGPGSLLPPHRRYEDGILVASSGNDDERSVVEDGLMKQHRSPEVLVDVQILDQFGYEIRCYPNSEVGDFNTSLNRFDIKHSDATIARYVVENPDRSLTNTTRLKITEFRGGKSNVTLYAKSGTVSDHTWTMSTGNGLRQESVRDYTLADTSTPVRVTEVSDATSNLLRRTTQEFYNCEWGRSLVRERVAVEPGDFDEPRQLITTWTYYATNGMPGYGQVAKQVNPDGSWTAFEYDAQNRQTKVTRGFKDGTGSPDVSQTVYDYTLHPGEMADYMWGTARTVIETTQGITNGISYQAYMMSSNAGERVEISERAASPTNAFGSARNMRTETVCYHDDYSDSNLVGRVKYVKQADGRLTSYSYEIGSYQFGTSGVFTAAGTGDYLRTTSIQGTGSNPSGIVNRTTASVSITDKLGRQVFTQSAVFNGSAYVPVDWTATFSDEAGHVTNSVSANGNSTETEWGCCGKERETDTFGIVTEYLYDDLKRVNTSIREGAEPDQYTLYTYDAEGRQLTQTISAGALSQASTNTYDLAGRVISSVDQSGVTTTYFYDGLTTKTIRGGLTNVTVNYLDGTGKYSSENGVIKSWTDVGINEDGTRWTTTFTGPDGTNSPMWQKTTTDFLGRTIKIERPGFGGTMVTADEVYNAQGQLVRSVVSSPSSVAMTLFEYNELGEQFRNCVDINTNGVVNLDGPDRVSESASSYQQEGGAYWQVRASIIYAGDGSATPTTNSIQKTRLTGFSQIPNLRSEMVGTDLIGNSTTSRSYVARATKTVTQIVTYPDSTNSAVQTTINGQLTTSLSKTGVRTEYTYDALGRQIGVCSSSGSGVIPPRSIATVTHYNAKGQVDSTMDAASNTTVFVYDDQGRRTAVTDALSNSTYTAYDAEGRVLATWGGTYPVAYDYDDFGRMTAMYTYRGTNSLSSYSDISNLKPEMDRTTWLYELASGLLTNKVYADGQGPAYTYTADGKLATRTWARGVTTAYNYNSLGQLTNINYSDDTPDVSFAYDRLGRQVSIIDATGTRTFAYNDALQLAAETNVMGVLSRQYDGLGRGAGFELWNGWTRFVASAYGYDSMGRFSSVTATNNQSPITNFLFCSYSYLTGSDLIDGWEISYGGTTSVSSARTYEPNRNLITQVLTTAGTNLISQFDYVNDAIGRRTQRIDSSTVVDSSSVTNDFGYNTRSELIEALMGTNSHSYRYDPIGNRKTATNNAEAFSYAANALNQYTNIADGVTTAPAYDADGNMVSYGDWTFGWNGENRLIAASNGATVVTFAYDFMGRRYQKVTGATTNTFLYEGWNLISEIQGATGVSPVTNCFTWGLDLSGTLQSAGGIGGLLSSSLITSNQSPRTSFYVFDANGNVVELVSPDGSVAASYQYDPYGNAIAKSGSLADINPFRFSSKYLDCETDFYYFGHRYHLPGLGRWISRDPIEEEGGPNLYVYLSNDPEDRVDPLGLVDLRRIPGIMRANGWNEAGTLLDRWFGNPVIGPVQPNTTTIRMEWVLGYARARAVYDGLFADAIYRNDAAKREIMRLLIRTGARAGDSFGNLNRSVLDVENDYVNSRVVGSTSDPLDGLFAALGRFQFRIAVEGNVCAIRPTSALVQLLRVGVYVRDSFDFQGEQHLGYWNDRTNYGGRNLLRGDAVRNRDFRAYSAANGVGQDFMVYSDIRITDLPLPPETISVRQ